jgi:hypothetical protein
MNRIAVVRTACAAALLAALPSGRVFADSRTQEQRATPSGSYFQLTPKPPRSPFAKLFVHPAPDGRAQRRAASDRPARPQVVCGTRVIPIDPLVDPKIYAPRVDDTRYTIRAVPPPICR